MARRRSRVLATHARSLPGDAESRPGGGWASDEMTEGLDGRLRRAPERVHAFLRREKGSHASRSVPESDDPSIACARCRKQFRKTRPWSRFCSTTCRMRFHGRLSGYSAGPDKAPAIPQKEIPS
jgi:hypothetical protein